MFHQRTHNPIIFGILFVPTPKVIFFFPNFSFASEDSAHLLSTARATLAVGGTLFY